MDTIETDLDDANHDLLNFFRFFWIFRGGLTFGLRRLFFCRETRQKCLRQLRGLGACVVPFIVERPPCNISSVIFTVPTVDDSGKTC